MRKGVFAGSFDPLTMGHMDIIKRACDMFDEVYVSVLVNSSKRTMFTIEERTDMIKKAVEAEKLSNVKVSCSDGLLVEHTRELGARYIIRGLRNSMDFEYERQLEYMNKRIDCGIETVYIMSAPEHIALSSSAVKELVSYKADIKGLVPEVNREYIENKK